MEQGQPLPIQRWCKRSTKALTGATTGIVSLLAASYSGTRAIYDRIWTNSPNLGTLSPRQDSGFSSDFSATAFERKGQTAQGHDARIRAMHFKQSGYPEL
jgi:hypothetical protein